MNCSLSLSILVAALVPATILTAQTPSEGTLRITRDFRHALSESRLQWQKRSVIEVLKEQTELETTGFGGFVQSIGDYSSSQVAGKNRDWFFYVNGMLAHVGAKSFHPSAGDSVWWDYHAWTEEFLIGAVIGDFPRPFLGGYQDTILPTRIFHTLSSKASAQSVEESLRQSGVESVNLTELDPRHEVTSEEHIYLAIGTWAELATHPFLEKLHRNGARAGLPFRMTREGSMELLDATGTTRETLVSGAVVAAAKLGTGSHLPLWIITGTDDELIHQAADLLASDAAQGFAAVAVSEQGVIRLPLETTVSEEAP